MNTQPTAKSETPESWSWETMQVINKLTPDIKGKAFDPGWFLLRERLETIERELNQWKDAATNLAKLLRNEGYDTSNNCTCLPCTAIRHVAELTNQKGTR